LELRQQILAKIYERVSILFPISQEELTENTRLVEDLHAKSANYSQITTFLEDEFDIEIPFMEFRKEKTLGAAADYVARLCEE
jgi:acyl carrier protein